MPSRSLSDYSASSEEFDLGSIAALMARARARWPRFGVAFSQTKKVPRRFRRSDVNDRDALKKIHEFQSGARAIKPAPLVAISKPSKPPLITSSKSPLITSKASPLKPSNDNRLPLWEDSSDRLKIVMANDALGRAGKQVASFTLDLSPDRIEAAQRHPAGLVDHLKRNLDKAFKRMLGTVPLYWFGVDATRSGRLHLHGGAAYDLEKLDEVQASLLHLGGEWTGKRGKERQLDMNLQRCDQGWVNYAIRHSGAVRKTIRGRTYTIAGPLRSMAKAHYDNLRAALKDS